MSAVMLAQKHLTVSLEIPSRDRAYQWVLQWISANAKHTQHLGVETTFKQDQAGNVLTHFDFVPSPGTHWIMYKRRLLQVTRQREKTMIDLNSGQPWETVTLTAVGRSRQIFADLLAEAKQAALKREEGKTVIYHSLGIEWRQFGQPRRRRPLHSVILAEGVAERIIADLKQFAASKDWYVDRGIPYRRGYLLYGPPGCGKSSFIQALAGELGYSICVLNLNERGLTDDKLMMLLSTPPPRSFILLEDVDAAFVKRDNKMHSSGVTFSGLLNALDGVASTEERIVFMTTNFPERLDPALIRPGRVDLKAEIGLATPQQVRLMFLRFYPEQAKLAAQFVEAVKEVPLAIAELQGYFMLYKEQPELAVRNVKRDLIEPKETFAKMRAAAPQETVVEPVEPDDSHHYRAALAAMHSPQNFTVGLPVMPHVHPRH